MAPEQVTLATRPTPVQPLRRLSAWLGAEVLVKRDDLTGMALSGNKVRKLELLLAQALTRGADTVITCGGIQSNHCRATAVAARQLGLEPVLLLRGEPPAAVDGNLLLDTLLGAGIHWCSAEDYATRRDALMGELADDLRAAGRHPYVIPEGGSNGLGALAFARAGHEVLAQVDGAFDAVFVAVGTGGTLAGLALGPRLGPLKGVAVTGDRHHFVAEVRRIAAEAAAHGLGPLPPHGESWEVVEGYQGPGYAQADDEVWQTVARLARLEGLLLDPVYTGKAMNGLCEEVRAGRVASAGAHPRVLFWHTGGVFGLFGRGRELARAVQR